MTATFALLHADTPTWIIVALRAASGCVRSIQYLALNTISFADVPAAAVAQHQRQRRVPAVGARLRRRVRRGAAGDRRRPTMLTVGDFRLVFLLIALVPLAAALGFLRLKPEDGAEVSGHRRTQSRAA